MKIIFRKLLPGTVVLIIALLYFFFDARKGGFPACPFYSLTGLFCPGCGSQRALSALLHGDVLQSLRYNPLLVVFSPLLLIAAYNSVRNSFKKDQTSISIFYSNKFVFTIIVIIITFGVLRNLPGFEWLAPEYNTKKGKTEARHNHHDTGVVIHQVFPKGSFTPPVRP